MSNLDFHMSNLNFQEVLQKDYKVFVDTSSMMQTDSEHVFYHIICPALSQFNQKILIPRIYYNEINSLRRSTGLYKNCTNILQELHKGNILHQIPKKKRSNLEKLQWNFDKNFENKPFLALFEKIITLYNYNLCWITNDEKLKENIIKLKNKVQNSKDIKLFYIKNKQLNEFKFKFSLPKSPKKNDTETSISIIPKKNDTITDSSDTSYKLLEEIGKGAEGSIYRIKNDCVCKIYEKKKNTKFRKEKIELLIKHKDSILVKNVFLPEEIAFNSKKEFAGYIMSQVTGKPKTIKSSIFIPLKHVNYNRIQLSKIAVDIIQKIQKLHQYNIILGDINPMNILIQDEENVFFIDTDSFQIEDYPCPVGVAQYTRPENDYSKNYKDYLRTKEDDIFAVFTLVFQLMLPGQTPYAHKGGGSLTKDSKNPKNFPYGFGKNNHSKNIPAGPWKEIWSELPENLKDLLGRFFKNREKIQLKELREVLKEYIEQLEKGNKTKEIIPSRKKV